VAEYLSWQLRNALALRDFELVAFAGLVVSGIGLYYSLKFLFRSLLDKNNDRHALVLDLREDRMAIHGIRQSITSLLDDAMPGRLRMRSPSTIQRSLPSRLSPKPVESSFC
jgi:hypothetical protein